MDIIRWESTWDVERGFVDVQNKRKLEKIKKHSMKNNDCTPDGRLYREFDWSLMISLAFTDDNIFGAQKWLFYI